MFITVLEWHAYLDCLALYTLDELKGPLSSFSKCAGIVFYSCPPTHPAPVHPPTETLPVPNWPLSFLLGSFPSHHNWMLFNSTLQVDLCFACISENTSRLSFCLSLISLSIPCSRLTHVAAYGGISSFCWLRHFSQWDDPFSLSIQSQKVSGPVPYLGYSTEWSQGMNGRHSAVKISGLNGHPGEVGISRGTLLLEDWEIPILLAIFMHHH